MVEAVNFKKAYLNEMSADVFFIFKTVANEIAVEEDQSQPGNALEKVPAHKIILSVGSKVFTQIFSSSSTSYDLIEVTEVPKNAFIEFLQFFYLVKPTVTFECVGYVLYLAELYNVSNCTRVCLKLLGTWVNPQQAIIVYELAKRFGNRSVEKNCQVIIASNIKDILLSDTFLTCSADCLKNVVGFWSFSAQLQFRACMDWSRVKCLSDKKNPNDMKHRRLAIGNAFELINFGQMQQEQLIDCISCYGELFTFEEIRQLFIDHMKRK